MSKRKVKCVETGEVFNSIKEASNTYKINSSSIRHCCIGKYMQAGGYQWEFYIEPDLPDEKWRGAKCITNNTLYDLSNIILVSNKGRIKRLENNCISYGTKSNCGYMMVEINDIKHSIHRIVATTFIPNPDNKSEVDHINTNKTDNRVSNLRWVTRKENLDNPITKERVEKARSENMKKAHDVNKKNGYSYNKESMKKAHDVNKKNGYKHSKENIKKASEATKVPVICIDTGIVYESAAYASRETNIDRSGITACCTGKQKSAGGYRWKHVNNTEED